MLNRIYQISNAVVGLLFVTLVIVFFPNIQEELRELPAGVFATLLFGGVMGLCIATFSFFAEKRHTTT